MTDGWIIFVRSGALGDYLLSLPLLRELQGTGRRLLVVTRPAYRAVTPPGTAPDAWLDSSSAATTGLFVPGAALAPDLAARLVGAEVHLFQARTLALADALEAQGARRVVWHDPRPDRPPHAALRFLAEAGYTPPAGLLDRPLWPPRPGPGSALWLHPGSGSRAKNWPVGVFAMLAAAWCLRHDGPVIVSFGEADTHLVGPCRRDLTGAVPRAQFVIGPTLDVLRERLRGEAALYIGNDSGVTHLAAALGVPTVVLYRVTDPDVWRPLGPSVPLSPCLAATAGL